MNEQSVQLIHEKDFIIVLTLWGAVEYGMQHAIRFTPRARNILLYFTPRRDAMVSTRYIKTTVVVGDVDVTGALSNIRKLIRKIHGDCQCLNTVGRKCYVFLNAPSGLAVSTRPAELAAGVCGEVIMRDEMVAAMNTNDVVDATSPMVCCGHITNPPQVE